MHSRIANHLAWSNPEKHKDEKTTRHYQAKGDQASGDSEILEDNDYERTDVITLGEDEEYDEDNSTDEDLIDVTDQDDNCEENHNTFFKGPRFAGITVKANTKNVPDESHRADKMGSPRNKSVRETACQIQQLMDRRPIATFRVIEDQLQSQYSTRDLQEALPFCGYMFSNGPWKQALIKFGVDPRINSDFRFYQTITFRMEFDPVVEPASTDQIRSEVSWRDGFFWNGTMAKLKVIMQDKIVCIRDCIDHDYDDYRCLLAFPEKYEPLSERDYTSLRFIFLCHLRLLQTAGASQPQQSLNNLSHPTPHIMVDYESSGSLSARQTMQSAPALQEPLENTQQQFILENVGNKRLASRLYKRTFKIFSKEERLAAIEFCQTRKHINLITGQERPISISSASEILHITTGTLKRWIMNKDKILEMKGGSSRADGCRENNKLPNRSDLEDYPFLRLAPQQLFQHKFVLRSDFYRLHPYDHPVPFIGIEGGRCGRLKNFRDAYQFMGQTGQSSHPGHPSEPTTVNSMDLRTQPLYKGAVTNHSRVRMSQTHLPDERRLSVQYINSQLYKLAPDYNRRRVASQLQDPFYAELGSCVAFICQQMINADSRLEFARPVRVGFDYHKPFQGAPQHWAIWLVYKANFGILLPLSLCLRGSVENDIAPDTLYLQGWTVDHALLKCNGRKRKLSPVLYIADVELLFLKSTSWRPRRFAPTWTLYSTVLHSSYRQESPLSPMYGIYTDVRLLMDAILKNAPRVSFSETLVQSSQLIELNHFVLNNKPTDAQILNQASHHIDTAGIQIQSNLRLEDIEKTFEEDLTDDSGRECRNRIQLKALYARPDKTWIIDFEFISMPARYSPIPLQLAIRQLDGELLYSTNVDYHMSMKDFLETASLYVSDKHKMMGTLFLRCYGDVKTNGETPSKIGEYITNVCGYDRGNVHLLSWFSAHDMQCFLRVLSGKDVLVHTKISHLIASNFQGINIGGLCRKLLPKLPSKQLESVKDYLVRDANVSTRNYHNAAYDTGAMAEIVKALVQDGLRGRRTIIIYWLDCIRSIYPSSGSVLTKAEEDNERSFIASQFVDRPIMGEKVLVSRGCFSSIPFTICID
ncbi:hypothetical protein ASPCADRAFT_506542 [Aspergillus carbonarius ITEM 5010]|uniref:Transcription factor IIIC subunit 5 HTH domain-containing protein n=1 Tax=Aspergillus carbonarius (strain ITEM 5010) TaxID=602072 RepID=A0A1R3RME0_ASPC5|nr:hypothetical protein ASPCADRAFT_506502 [Aspergillus carbonarius ITEM 5010]OOF95703.1 hypothetical protein ASPCADRAFT_506542 [Aspergillus carbonarius ITEM 5010]